MKESVETLTSCGAPVSWESRTHWRSRWRQTNIAVVVNIISFVTGVTYGWAAPILPILQSEHSPIGIPPITDAEASWLASIMALSRVVLIPVYVYCNNRFGRKFTGYLMAAPFIVGSALLLFANSFPMLLWGRFLNGVGAGGSVILVPAYVSDIAADNIKGQLGMVYGLAMTFGMTFAYVMGPYTSFATSSLCNLLLPVAFLLAFFWMPESPLFLMTQGKEEQAKKNLIWLRDQQDNENELERLRLRANAIWENRKRKLSFSNVMERATLRGLLICLGLIANQQMSGPAVIASYTVDIFRDAGSTIPPNIATIIYGVVQIIGTSISSIVIERSGRRFLLLFSDIFMALSLAVLGLYFYFQSLDWNLEYFGWIPVTSLSLYILCIGIGLGPLPFSIVTELISSHSLGFVQGIIFVFWSLASFLLIIAFNPLKILIGQYGCFWLFSAACVVSSVLIFLTVPETKNRSLEDVLKQMQGTNYIRSVIHFRSSV